MTTISKFTLNATEGRTEIGYSVSNSNINRFITVIITVIGLKGKKKKRSKVIKLFKKSNRYFMYYCIRCIKKHLSNCKKLLSISHYISKL